MPTAARRWRAATGARPTLPSRPPRTAPRHACHDARQGSLPTPQPPVLVRAVLWVDRLHACFKVGQLLMLMLTADAHAACSSVAHAAPGCPAAAVSGNSVSECAAIGIGFAVGSVLALVSVVAVAAPDPHHHQGGCGGDAALEPAAAATAARARPDPAAGEAAVGRAPARRVPDGGCVQCFSSCRH